MAGSGSTYMTRRDVGRTHAPLAGGLLAGAGLGGAHSLRGRHDAALLDLEWRDVCGRVLVALALLGLGLFGHNDAWLVLERWSGVASGWKRSVGSCPEGMCVGRGASLAVAGAGAEKARLKGHSIDLVNR